MSGRQRAHDQPECPHCETDLLVSGSRGRGAGTWHCHGCETALTADGEPAVTIEVGDGA